MPKESLATIDKRVDTMIFEEKDVESAKAKLVELMDATMIARGTTRTTSGSPIYEKIPDTRVQLAAAAKIIEWGKGKPKQLIDIGLNDTGKRTSNQAELAKIIGQSPELVDKIIGTLKEGLKIAQEVDVTPVKAVVSDLSPDSESVALPPAT